MFSLEKIKTVKIERRKRFSANRNVFIWFFFTYTHAAGSRRLLYHLNKVPELEPLFYTSYQYPSQLKFNRFRVSFSRNRCIGWCVPSPSPPSSSLDVRTTHMSNISAMALKFFKICHASSKRCRRIEMTHLHVRFAHHSHKTPRHECRRRVKDLFGEKKESKYGKSSNWTQERREEEEDVEKVTCNICMSTMLRKWATK